VKYGVSAASSFASICRSGESRPCITTAGCTTLRCSASVSGSMWSSK
jgi:hypothetical protein